MARGRPRKNGADAETARARKNSNGANLGFEAKLRAAAVQVMGDDRLRVIAHELLTSLKGNVTVDWVHREAARARVPVKRILRKYGYPPDLQDAAVQTVLQQAEVLSARWAA